MRISAILCSLLLLGSSAFAQAEAAPASIRARLIPDAKVITAGAEASLTLQVQVLEDAEVDATILRGVHLEIRSERGQPVTIGEQLSGAVKVAAGTEIKRKLTVNLQVRADDADSGLRRVMVAWPGLAGASASLQIAPDQSNIAVDELDLAQTKVMLITSEGNITLGFMPEKAPNHVKNFVKLSKDGFYDGTKFHRVIRNFMVQGGCPNTKAGATGAPGTGNPGYTVDAEFNDVRHVKGVVSAARSADPNSAGCQFFICHGEASWLDGKYTAFGLLAEGEDTLDKIANKPVTARGGEASVPTEPIHLYKAIVLPVKR